MDLFEQLRRDEGLRLKPYKDTVGKWTIGIGRNLDDVGISQEEAEHLLANDVAKVKEQLATALPWIATLDEVRQAALYNMAFNLGVPGLLKFKNTLLFVQGGHYDLAADGMLYSLWAKQVGPRAKRLSDQMRTGIWQ